MNHNRKAKALKVYSDFVDQGMTQEEATSLLIEQGYSKEESEIVVAAYSEPQTQAPPQQADSAIPFKTELKVKPEPQRNGEPVDPSRLSDPQYWKEYNEKIAALPQRTMFQWRLMEMTPIIKERFEGMPNSPRDIVGARLKRDSEIHRTNSPVNHILELNRQWQNNGRLYVIVNF